MLEAVAQQPSSVLVPTTERPAGYEVKRVLGQVFGVVVRSRGLGGNIVAGLRSIVGGEIHEYTQLLEETRRQAIDRMVALATIRSIAWSRVSPRSWVYSSHRRSGSQ